MKFEISLKRRADGASLRTTRAAAAGCRDLEMTHFGEQPPGSPIAEIESTRI